ncbi:putative activating signal cointegrator 1 complex subunit 3 family 1 ASCC3L1 protein [Toxoplasma gondii MAS]|uniref:Putative activating signal cointegrator 1 complex subunit 3 family 1 ASCC3L1 protein n=1 Tax=Toxoplasma gondii MAS TaxID=943118 RepID=A0A086PYY7_TOXGO|nr:putative activating signal cointegrator 1 complex subunit 3 family 1 ASCC3L1 protein [Toxoplasma gondii MAS]
MAEEFERFKRFEYRQNSNLVLQRDTSTGVAPAVHLGEPTGEPESLAGRKLYPMGDKVERGLKKEDRPVKNDSKRAKLKRNKLVGERKVDVFLKPGSRARAWRQGKHRFPRQTPESTS